MSVPKNSSNFQNMYWFHIGWHSNLDSFLRTDMKKRIFKLALLYSCNNCSSWISKIKVYVFIILVPSVERGPTVVIDDRRTFSKFTENIHDVLYTWTGSVVNQYVPDVRSAIRSFVGFISGVLLSILVLFNPKTWISKLPTISRRRVRWRRKR